jgi:hypothetical protein
MSATGAMMRYLEDFAVGQKFGAGRLVPQQRAG